MSQWNLTLTSRRDVYCPVCIADLNSIAARVRWGVACCKLCDQMMTHEQAVAMMNAMDTQTELGNTTDACGVTLWTPKEPWKQKVSPVAATILTGNQAKRTGQAEVHPFT